MNEREIFLEALKRSDPAEREAYLNRACGQDPELRRSIETRLKTHEAAGGSLRPRPPAAEFDASTHAEVAADAGIVIRTADRSPAVPTDLAATSDYSPPPEGEGRRTVQTLAERPGSTIGPYKLLEVIGEGGMGSVFLAGQEKPVRRKVALKVIKAGMDTAQVIARFEAERQALALMDHPHIARVLDAGATDTGRPFFVMELVSGLSITKYCDEARLTPHARLKLMIPVCQAVQHAHQKGVIHRDIKPSNVLVTEVDGKPVPKVIDFGVAKATDQRLAERTLFTKLGAIVGTPEYMSPEQAGLGATDIDTRSDVYSLGVLLYELLTGSTPLDRAKLREAGFAEMLRWIREEQPPTPSSRLSASREELPSLSAVRRTEPARLSRLVRGDLDWIVMRALEKDRARRYETANALAQDLQRYLDGEPVEAGPPSRCYRLGKYAKRHRVALLTAGTVLLLTDCFAVGMYFALRRAQVAERLASNRELSARDSAIEAGKARDSAMQALVRSERAEETARAQLARKDRMFTFLTTDLLSQAEPEKHAAEDKVTLLEVLDRAAEKVGARYAGQPDLEAEIRSVIGRTYHGLASWKKSEAQWRAALDRAVQVTGPGSVESLTATSELGHVLEHSGRVKEALPLLVEAAMGLEDALGPTDPTTLTARINVARSMEASGEYAKAREAFQELTELCEKHLGSNHESTLSSRSGLAAVFVRLGRHDDAIAILRENVHRAEAHFGPEHSWTLNNRGRLGQALAKAGRFEESTAFLDGHVAATEKRFGADHTATLSARLILGETLVMAGRHAEAIDLLKEVTRLNESRHGPHHPDTLIAQGNLARTLVDVGRSAEAIEPMREILKLVETQSGPEHPDSATVRINLAAAYVQVGRYQEAVPLLSSGLRIIEAKLGNRHPTALSAKSGLAGAYFGLGRYAEMIDLLSDVAREAEDQKGPDHPDTLTAWATLGQGYLQTMRFAEAVDLLERVTKRSVARLGSDHPLTLQGLTHLAGGYHGLGRVDEAVEMLRDVVGRGEARWGSDHPRTLGAVHGLAHALEVSRPAEAESHFHRALLGFQKLEGSNGPIVLDLSNDLANVLTRLKRYGEAEPYLRQMLVRDRSRFGPRSPQTSLRLAQIGMVLLFQEKWREAESTLRECLSIREVGEPNAWNTFNTRSQLGASLLAQSRHTEAEPLIVGGYEGLKAREKTIPPLARIRLVESAARVVKLYESWGKPEAAANWRKQLMPDLSDLDAGFPMNPFVTP